VLSIGTKTDDFELLIKKTHMQNGKAESNSSNNVEFAFNPHEQRVSAALCKYRSLLT